MKALKSSALREMKAEELSAKLEEAHENLRKLKMRKASRQLEDTASLKVARRDVGRIESMISEKARAGAKDAGEKKEAASAAKG